MVIDGACSRCCVFDYQRTIRSFTTIFIAWFLAYLLYPIVKFVQYKLHVPGRAISIIVTLAFVVAIITAIFMFIIPPMLDQVDRFTHIINPICA